MLKDCIGAIDGTHIRVKVSNAEAPKYCGRKDYPTQNVLAACTFDLKFSYVLTRWEGTASDSRIIKNALTRNSCLKIPEVKTDPDKEILAEVDREIENSDIEEVGLPTRDDHQDACRGETIRDSIAYQMWANYSL